MNLLKVQGYTYGMNRPRLTAYTVKYDASGTILNPRTIAASKQYGWGEWQSSEKVPCSLGDCWWCTTASHGGYVLVTQNKDLPFTSDQARRLFKEPSRVVNRPPLFYQVFEFEEDCDWAILEYNDPLLREFSLTRINRNRAEAEKPPRNSCVPQLTAEEYWRDHIIKTMRMYAKSLLKDEDQEEVTVPS